MADVNQHYGVSTPQHCTYSAIRDSIRDSFRLLLRLSQSSSFRRISPLFIREVAAKQLLHVRKSRSECDHVFKKSETPLTVLIPEKEL